MKNKKAQESFLTLIITTLIIIFLLFIFLFISFIVNPFKGKTEIKTIELSYIQQNHLILNSLIFSQLNEEEKKEINYNTNLNYFYELFYLYLIEKDKENKNKIEKIIKNRFNFLENYILRAFIYDINEFKYEEFFHIEKLSINQKIARNMAFPTSAAILVKYGLIKEYKAYVLLPYNKNKLILIILTTT